MRRNIDGFEDQRQGRSNRNTAVDDDSMLGRGHGFGPKAGRGMRRPKRGEQYPLNHNYARVADEPRSPTRESRGPETSHYLEDDTYARGSTTQGGYGSRSRSMESTHRRRRGPDGRPMRDEFDDDLIR